jgi:hypothetical protein
MHESICGKFTGLVKCSIMARRGIVLIFSFGIYFFGFKDHNMEFKFRKFANDQSDIDIFVFRACATELV